MRHAALLLLLPVMSNAANYTARKSSDHGLETVVLTDAAHKTEVAIAPSFGNMAYQMKVNGKDALFLPVPNLGELTPTLYCWA